MEKSFCASPDGYERKPDSRYIKFVHHYFLSMITLKQNHTERLKMVNKNKKYSLAGIIGIILFISFADVNGMEDYQHPDESFHISILQHNPLSHVSVLDDIRPETKIIIFWLYGMIFKSVLLATGLIVFSCIFVVKGVVRLFRDGKI